MISTLSAALSDVPWTLIGKIAVAILEALI